MSTDRRELKTLSYLHQIRKHLWLHRVYGKAAVMVGAGFSRNALAKLSSTEEFPLWSKLAEVFCDGLNPRSSPPPGSSPLQLAGHYEARFGRTSLNKLLVKTIPDESYEPGELHGRLLSLPWADVFTTNYDTLLERSSHQLPPERHYALIRTIDGIAGSSQPRITKLHGSFPDHLPFIITEEDYRTYPERFAPFVNMVQQSMMENAFCLIGFSGDDPNFHAWAGWVRDNLKATAPRIYLCDLSGDMDEARVQYFENRNIAIVDLSILAPNGSQEDKLRAFLGFLEEGRPGDPLDWARESTVNHGGEPESVGWWTTRLQAMRKNYPGWVVCPHEIRARLWQLTLEQLVQQTLHRPDFEDLPLAERLSFLKELAWVLDVCLFPLFDPAVSKIEEALEEWRESSVDDLVPDVVELLFALARYAREEMDEQKHQECLELIGRLRSEVLGAGENTLRLHYEKCLWAWFTLRYDELETLVKDWPKGNPNQFWETKRASLLLALGQYADGWTVLDAALTNIRKQSQEHGENIELLSQEAWTMLLLYRRDLLERENRCEEFRGRWVELGRFGIDPRSELERIGLGRLETHTTQEREREQFDLGRVTRSSGTNERGQFERHLRDRSVLRVYEEAALPISLGVHAYQEETISRLFPNLLGDSPLAGLSLAMRFARKGVTQQLSRLVVASLPQEKIEKWGREVLSHVPFWVERLPSLSMDPLARNPWYDLLVQGIEILSRLVQVFTEEGAFEFLNVLCALYKSPVFRSSNHLYSSLADAWKRCILAVPRHSLVRVATQALDLPLGDAEGSPLVFRDRWPEPFFTLTGLANDTVDEVSDACVSRIRGRIVFLIGQVANGEKGGEGNRARALVRLSVLYDMGLLEDGEKASLAETMWSRLDEKTGLPDLDGLFYPHAVLYLPERRPGEAEHALQHYLSTCDIVGLSGFFKESKSYVFPPAISQNVGPTIAALNGATENRWSAIRPDSPGGRLKWSSPEARKIINDGIEVWQNQKKQVTRWGASHSVWHAGGYSEIRSLFLGIATLITKTMLPFVKRRTRPLHSRIRETLCQMIEYEIPVHCNLHMLFLFGSDDLPWVRDEVLKAMHSEDEVVSGNAFAGIRDWALMDSGAVDGRPEIPSEIRTDLLALTLTQNTKAMHTLLRIDAQLVSQVPDFFSFQEKRMLTEALNSISASVLSPWDAPSRGQSLNAAAHSLAAALYSDFQERGEPIPETLSRWRPESMDALLPEVRDSWHSILTSRPEPS